MRRSEALAELELGEYGTPLEIKAAYRDLVKVWHPDRFGNDERMRRRAEERLQRINEAYRRLEAGDFAPEPAATAPPSYAAEGHSARRAGGGPKTRAERDRALRGWVYVAIFLLAALFAGYVVVEHVRAERQGGDLVEPPVGPSISVPARSARPTAGPNRSGHRDEPQVRVTNLSEAQMEQLETVCGGFAPESEQHVDCVRVQLASMTGRVDLSGLTDGERTAIRHMCARSGDSKSYSQCAAEQLTSLSAVTLRPDVSRLNAQDRSAVERSCSAARDHDGPAAYDRCVVEFEKALAGTR